MMKKFFYGVAFTLTLILASCDEPVEEPGVRMEFAETQCANPWQTLPGSANYLFSVHQYLTENGLDVYSIAVEKTHDYNQPRCEACTCSSGRRIVIRISKTDVESAEEIGFYRAS